MVCLQVRAVSPFLGPPSDFGVVKMIPNERLPPRNLHRVRTDKTQALLKWQPPYDSPKTSLVRNRIVPLSNERDADFVAGVFSRTGSYQTNQASRSRLFSPCPHSLWPAVRL